VFVPDPGEAPDPVQFGDDAPKATQGAGVAGIPSVNTRRMIADGDRLATLTFELLDLCLGDAWDRQAAIAPRKQIYNTLATAAIYAKSPSKWRSALANLSRVSGLNTGNASPSDGCN